jgi:hypothetical protein
VIHLTYFFIADPKIQRWFGLTNFFYLPFGLNFDNHKTVNVSTAHQFTYVPQIGYTEGLGKFSPVLNGVFFDLIANASFHTTGSNPVGIVDPAVAPFPGVLTYDTLTQGVSYDVRAFLRYGEQIATNGRFAVTGLPIVGPQPNLSLGKDDFLRSHLQFQVPFEGDVLVGADVFHDFDSVGGFRNNIGVEVRLTKIFFPPPPSR